MHRSKGFVYALLAAGFIAAVSPCPASAEIFYPWKDAYLGSLDAGAWAGLVIVPSRESAFAFRFRVEKEGRVAESSDLYYLVSEVGPNSPDGQYARLRFDLGMPFRMGGDTPVKIKPAERADAMTLEWSRQDEKTVIGRLRFPKNVKVSMVFYFPWDTRGSYEILADGRVQGQSEGGRRHYFDLWTDHPGRAPSAAARPLSVEFSAEDGRSLYFAAAAGDDPRYVRNHIYRYQNRKTIDSILSEEEAGLRKKRVRIEGLFAGAPEAVSDNAFWSTLYQAGQHRFYAPASRNAILPGPDGTAEPWTIGGGDAFFSALTLAVESPKHAIDAVRAVLETQYPDGNIPGWRSPSGGSADRSRPPVGSYVVLKLFQRVGDMEILRHAFPYLSRWHAFWSARTAEGGVRQGRERRRAPRMGGGHPAGRPDRPARRGEAVPETAGGPGIRNGRSSRLGRVRLERRVGDAEDELPGPQLPVRPRRLVPVPDRGHPGHGTGGPERISKNTRRSAPSSMQGSGTRRKASISTGTGTAASRHGRPLRASIPSSPASPMKNGLSAS